MTPPQFQFLSSLFLATFADPPTQTPSEWCCQNLRFDEPDNRGPFTLLGREYAREPLDDVADPLIARSTFVWGSQTTKTGTIMGRTAWQTEHEGCRVFWVMPNQDLVRKFSATRWSKFVLASPILAARVPTGAQRHAFSTLQQQIGRSIIDFIWAGSPAALSSTPARVINLDEVDKFNAATDKEADSVDLAEQRTKSFSNPKLTETSTPTTEDGPIWQSFLKSDQRRRNVPCPNCQKLVIFAWSKAFTIFPLTGNEAFAKWDKEAQNANGSWDLERVERSARYECPFCAFHIQDRHKTLMDRAGKWIPAEKRCRNGTSEVTAATGHRGYHLPSFYAPSAQCNVGKLAIKFLQKKGTLDGLQGVINGDFSEPFANQDKQGERVEIIVRESEAPKLDKATKLLSADFQVNAPHLWYVVREWGNAATRGIEAGPLMEWEQLYEVQQRHGIPNNHVGIDSGDQTMVVYEQCIRHGILIPRPQRAPIAKGWIPMKGMSREGWRNQATGAKSKVRLEPQEHFIGGKTIAVPLLEFVDHDLKNFLDLLRKGKITGLKWEVSESCATEEYWRHMDGEIKIRERNKNTGKWEERWKPRTQAWPNHILDAEKNNLALAMFLGLIHDAVITGVVK